LLQQQQSKMRIVDAGLTNAGLTTSRAGKIGDSFLPDRIACPHLEIIR
jgi:hypothetical protein